MKLFRTKKPAPSRARRSPDTSQRPITSSYSYRTSRSEEEQNLGRNTNRSEATPAPKNRFGRLFVHKFGLLVLLLAITVSLVNILHLSPSVKLATLDGSAPGGGIHSRQEYADYASDLLRSSIFNSNKITLDAASINQQMVKKFPELASANLSVPLLAKKPTLYLDSTSQALILLTPTGTFLVNDRGKAIANIDNPQAAAGADIALVNDQSGLSPAINKQLLSSTNVSFIETVYGQLRAKGYKPTIMTLPPSSSELDVALEGQPYQIKFNLRSNTSRQQVGTFLATINKLKSQNITPTQYVDVRVDGRAYYL